MKVKSVCRLITKIGAAKRYLIVLIAGLCFAAGLSAQEFGLSAGIGGFTGGEFGSGAEEKASLGSVSVSEKVVFPYFGGGGYLFFDATFVEASFGFYGGGGKAKLTQEGPGVSYSDKADLSIMSLNLGLFFKYPFEVDGQFRVFPLAGIDYLIALLVRTDDEEYKNSKGKGSSGNFSSLWFKAGAGLDVHFTDSIFLRLEALYGLRLANEIEKDLKDAMNEDLAKAKAAYVGMDGDSKILLGHGLTVKLALGIKIF